MSDSNKDNQLTTEQSLNLDHLALYKRVMSGESKPNDDEFLTLATTVITEIPDSKLAQGWAFPFLRNHFGIPPVTSGKKTK